ncbi:MAG: LON peptidase substrate-binding domain-containing protein [Gammaproteobacteria bacterium]
MTTAQSASERLPLFPLQTVFYPGTLLPLRIFETRYLDMVSTSLRAGQPFGIVPIRRGREVGAPAEFHAMGTLATITSFDRGDDGLLQLVVEGGERFRVTAHTVMPDRLTLADLVRVPAADDGVIPEDLSYLRALLQEVYERNAAAVPYTAPRWDSALWLAYRLGELLPLPLPSRLAVLEAADGAAALRLIDAALRAQGANPPPSMH